MTKHWSNPAKVNNSTFSHKYEKQEKTRLDVFLTGMHPDESRSRIQKWISAGMVCVNEKTITKTGFMLEFGDFVLLNIPEPEPTQTLAEDIKLDVLFENEDILVINKTAGMVVHPGAGHATGTVVNAALAHAPEMVGIGGEGRPGVVHRLDKDTSGILILAKNDLSHRWLQDQFRLREIKKVYIALVDGKPPTPEGIIEAAIARDPSHRKQMSIVQNGRGREAKSQYLTLKEFTSHTLVEVYPFTGRTHQIRLHMAFVGCPIVGDRQYGYKKLSIDISRHFLHAARISFLLPRTNEMISLEAPLPEELNSIIEQLI